MAIQKGGKNLSRHLTPCPTGNCVFPVVFISITTTLNTKGQFNRHKKIKFLERFYIITYLHFFCDSRQHYWRQNWFGNFYGRRSRWRCSVASVVPSCAWVALFGRASTEIPPAWTTCGFQPQNSFFIRRFFSSVNAHH